MQKKFMDLMRKVMHLNYVVEQQEKKIKKAEVAVSSLSHKKEYPSPDQRGPIPQNAHPDSTFSSHLHNDWTHVQEESSGVGREWRDEWW
jgi:hypothetical protein